jgi:Tol biopolymer transport system component
MIPYATWNPDGTHIVFNTWAGQDGKGPVGLFVVDVRTGEQHEIDLPEGLRATRITQWSPDGRWIGVIRGSGSYELWVAENVLDDRTNSR